MCSTMHSFYQTMLPGMISVLFLPPFFSSEQATERQGTCCCRAGEFKPAGHSGGVLVTDARLRPEHNWKRSACQGCSIEDLNRTGNQRVLIYSQTTAGLHY